MIVCLCVAGLGGWFFASHQRVQRLGQQVYKEYPQDGLPLPKGVLDDPAFAGLPPQTGPINYGRYKPPKVATRQSPAPAARSPVTTPPPEIVPGPAATPKVPENARAGHTELPAQVTAAPPAAPPAAAKPPTAPISAQVSPSAVPPKSSATPPSAPVSFTERLTTAQTIHLLLIGNDQPRLGHGRADVLMVVTLDSRRQEMVLLSIPRDTRIHLPGHGEVKINAAYAYGGAGLQTAAVERFLGIPMDKIIEISLDGFHRAIDAVGGVTVDPAFAFSLDAQHFQPGSIKLSGVQALAYTRMRHDDPEGDLGRNKRQQEVIRALVGDLGQLPSASLLEVVGKLDTTLRTNFSPSEVVRLRTDRPYLLDHQRRESVQGKNAKIGGIWYFLVGDQERRRLNLLLR